MTVVPATDAECLPRASVTAAEIKPLEPPGIRLPSARDRLPRVGYDGATMSPLAEAIYDILRDQAAQPEPRITYAELAARLRDTAEEFEYVHHRNRELYAALAEVGRECRRLKLAPLPALVVRADTGRPGAAYFAGKCTGVVYRGEQTAAWRRDMEAVRRATYPPRGHELS